MVVLYILGALLLLIGIVISIRVGILISFGETMTVRVKIGPVTRQIVPKPDKPKKPGKPKKPKPEKEPKEKPQEKKKKKLDLTFDDIRSAFPALFESLSRGLRKTRKRLKIHPMTVAVTFGGDDPAKVSEMYGWASTAMWTVMPRLEQLIRMPDPRIHLDVDYTALKTVAEGEIGISLLIRDGLSIGGSFGIPLLKWFLSMRKRKASRDKTDSKDNQTNAVNKGE